MVHLVGGDVLFEVLGGVEVGSGFEEDARDAEIGQHFDGGAAAGAGSDHDDVRNLWRTYDLQHPAPSGPSP